MKDAARAPREPIPVIDLFAGPGGLGEGFSQVRTGYGAYAFRLCLSIEKDAAAHRTLELRSMYRWFRGRTVPEIYWEYVAGRKSREELVCHPTMAEAVAHARKEARCAELGVTPQSEIDAWIEQAIGGRQDWVLLGGPPCQAYSLVGRARQSRKPRAEFERDHRHLLYEEYLRIVRTFHPAVFVMENVKGLLSATYAGEKMFQRICSDLSLAAASSGHQYQIRSFVVAKQSPDPRDFVIRAEEYGVPQARHRVILLGVRDDLSARSHKTLRRCRQKHGVGSVLGMLPPLRSSLSRGADSHEAWLKELKQTPKFLRGISSELKALISPSIHEALKRAEKIDATGGRFVPRTDSAPAKREQLFTWLRREEPSGWLNHEARSHMPADLRRYLFAATYAQAKDCSPKVTDFPLLLRPDHKNVARADDMGAIPFADRFRVQRAELPSTTVVSHIAKDGHYFIHYDPAQARSLTVREAARLQTFPDNYFFEGNRTEQFIQVGNAVPPYLAFQLGRIVRDLMSLTRKR